MGFLMGFFVGIIMMDLMGWPSDSSDRLLFKRPQTVHNKWILLFHYPRKKKMWQPGNKSVFGFFVDFFGS